MHRIGKVFGQMGNEGVAVDQMELTLVDLVEDRFTALLPTSHFSNLIEIGAEDGRNAMDLGGRIGFNHLIQEGSAMVAKVFQGFVMPKVVGAVGNENIIGVKARAVEYSFMKIGTADAVDNAIGIEMARNQVGIGIGIVNGVPALSDGITNE